MTPDRDNIRFNVLRNALYHTARRRWFESWNRRFNFLVILLGAAAVGDLATRAGFDPISIGVAVATIGALQLVFDFSGQARDHQTLQRAYYHLLADIEATLNDTDEDRARWYGDMIRITADEAPTMRAADARAYNDAIDATEMDPDQRLIVPLLHQLLAHFVAFEGRNYPKLCERSGAHRTGQEA
ncbi:hypothetical protein ACVDG3_06775 [Meridianimarinicoccus sp. RP-17]|uniref:hypothetical protein n=1 Tax=Meridianimarinicoccus zhengii TaxID=2056810 RepID=UPI000DABB94B|nr:hypothetical protein [Phycocomes zhengii]